MPSQKTSGHPPSVPSTHRRRRSKGEARPAVLPPPAMPKIVANVETHKAHRASIVQSARGLPHTLRFSVEFQWFFSALSVRPGTKRVRRAHWLPKRL